MAPNEYTIHYNPFSICSIMARMTMAFRPDDPDNVFHEQLVDIYKYEQLSESFLTTANPKGQVPALTSPSLTEPITDSLDITYFLCDLYPTLAPKEHREAIYRLLKENHRIQYLSLSFTPAENRAGFISTAIENLLAHTDISEEYRKALEFKAAYHERVVAHALDPAPIELAENQTQSFFFGVQELRSKFGGQSSWIFGDEVGPTALDAHTIAFIARLYDANRKDLIPEDLQKYGKAGVKTAAWNTVTGGKPTLHGLWMKMQ